MFLGLLNDGQKKLFLELAVKAAEANDVVTVEEQNVMEAFAREMQIEPVYNSDDSLDELLEQFCSSSSQKVKRIVLFELLGVLFSDSEFDEKEKLFISSVIEKFGIDESKVKDMRDAITEYANLYNRIVRIVFE